MYTLRFEVPRLRPDFARFRSEAEYKGAVTHMIHTRYAGSPLRIRVTDRRGDVVYAFDRA